MANDVKATTAYRWRFFRSGGFDQVRIDNGEDLRHLGELDQKLWSVLACPTSGLEFDTRTLQMLDADGDGRIRAPEIVAAARWVCAVLCEPDVLFSGASVLPLSAIDHSSEEGARILATARRILAILDKPDAEVIELDDFQDNARLYAAHQFNGDGIAPPALATDARLASAIQCIIDTLGSVSDRSGEPGVDRDKVDDFFAQAEALSQWRALADADPDNLLPLGDSTDSAAAVVDAVRAKVDDFFTRCRLAAYDLRAQDALNPTDTTYATFAVGALNDEAEAVAALPLALVGPDKALPLAAGLNPAWSDIITRLRDEVVQPLFGVRDALTETDWKLLAERFSRYREWQTTQPATALTSIAAERLKTMLADDTHAALQELIERDRAAETTASQIEAVERLVRYQRDLVRLLRNFVSLTDFYGGREKAIFQVGTLYLDQRSCELCLRVVDMDRHTALAPLSGTYLVYCLCQRHGEASMTIVAAMTDGDADEMMVPGRNGMFYDRQGRDWSASVIKVMENPISVRQAFWSPYKRIGRMMGEQMQKFAASRDKAVEDTAAARVADASAGPQAPSTNVQQAFDIAKFAGIFAAIGLALGALGTALAAIITGFLALPVWKMPLVIVGLIVLVSGPSMLLAWLKLSQRNLGPLLDANGWAVNTRARINIPFGAALTGVATLPKGAERSFTDPYAEKRTAWKRWVLLLIIAVGSFHVWQQGYVEALFGMNEQATTEAITAPAATEPAPKPAEATNPELEEVAGTEE